MFAAQFTTYEVFAIISGVSLIVMAMLPGLDGSSRAWSFVGGAFFIGYGIYVAQQTTGTYYFPAWIFVIPFAAVIYLAISVYEWFSEGSEPSDPGRRPGATSRTTAAPRSAGTPNTTLTQPAPPPIPASSPIGAQSPAESPIAAQPRAAGDPTTYGEVRIPPQPGTGHDS